MNYEATLTDSPAANCLSLLERHAPRFLRIGGGIGFQAEHKHRPAKRRHRMTDAERAVIIAAGKRHRSVYDVAAEVGWSVTHTWRVLSAAKLPPLNKNST